MEREKVSPLATSVTLAEDIHRMIDEMRLLLILGIASSVWIVLLGVFWLLQEFLSILSLPYVAWFSLGVAGSFIVPFSIPSILSSRERLKELRQWDAEFIRFSYILRFEFLPSQNPDPIERIFEQILNVFVRLGDIFETNKIDPKPFVKVEVEGKKSSHVFDIYIGTMNTEDQDKALDDFHRNNGDLFVRRFSKTSPVTESDVKTLFDDVSDVVKETGSETVFRIVAVSGSSFDESAKAFVRNKKNWIFGKFGKSADLIEETPEGFRVIWVS